MAARFKQTGAFGILSSKGKGDATADAARLVLAYDDGRRHAIVFAQLKAADFNSSNGLWTFKGKDGSKINVQTTGALFSVGDRAEGRALNEAIAKALDRHKLTGLVI